MLPGWASWVVVSRDAQTLSVPLPIVNAGCWLFMVAGDEVPVIAGGVWLVSKMGRMSSPSWVTTDPSAATEANALVRMVVAAEELATVPDGVVLGEGLGQL